MMRKAPARVTNPSGPPPTFIAAGGRDLFAAQDIAHAQRLNAATVPVERPNVPGAWHRFDRLVAGARVSRQIGAATISALKRGPGQGSI